MIFVVWSVPTYFLMGTYSNRLPMRNSIDDEITRGKFLQEFGLLFHSLLAFSASFLALLACFPAHDFALVFLTKTKVPLKATETFI